MALMMRVKVWASREAKRERPTTPDEEFTTGDKVAARHAVKSLEALGEGSIAVIYHPTYGARAAYEWKGTRAYPRNPLGFA